MDREQLTRRRFIAAAALSTTLAGCGSAPQSGTEQQEGDGESASTPSGGVTQLADSQQNQGESSVYTQVYREAIDSIVLIRVYNQGRSGQGSGFVYDGRHVVTNQHVVETANDVQIRFANGEWRSATVVGTDVYSDLAVLHVQDLPSGTPSLPLVEGGVDVGQEVVAIGNPFGLSGSVSAGIVSGVDRTLPAANNFSIPDAIQTDAAVNPGNSGGPLMTIDAEVAGVINSGSGDNIGFAISAPLMQRVVPALIENGNYEHSYMGVRLVSVNPLIAEGNNLDEASGVYIDDVLSNEPSDGVLEGSTGETTVNGVRVPTGGDVVVSMDGVPLPTRQALSTFLALQTSPGDTIPVEIIRDGRRTTVDLTLGSRPEP